MIQLDHSAAVPLYQQIADQLREAIRRGLLPPGFRLPPSRLLAAQLGTHRNTVVRAFDELAQSGVLSATVGRGTFVAETPLAGEASPAAGDRRSGRPDAPRLSWASILSRRSRSHAGDRFERLQQSAGSSPPINLQRMQASSDLLPVDALRRCVDHVLRTTRGRALGYAPREGLGLLRERIATLLVAGGIPARADDILITNGSQQALDLITRALVDPGDALVVDAATYSGAIHLFSTHGANLVPVRSDDEGPMMSALSTMSPRGVKGLYVMPNGRNPTGGMIGARRRHELVEWSRAHGIPLIEDDYGADLNLDGEPTPPALRALDPDVLYVATFSKKLIPALRLGFVVCAAPVHQRLVSLKHASDLGASLLMQHALAEFLDRGYLRTHLKTVLSAYRERRDTLEAALSTHIPKEVTWRHTARGVAAWLELPPHVDPEAVFREALQRGVLVMPGTLAAVGDGAAPGIRLTFCAEPPERIVLGVKRLSRALEVVLAKRTRTHAEGGPALSVV